MAKFLGGKSANELLLLCQILRFFTPRGTKSTKYIGVKFIGTVNHAVPFQYSELLYGSVSQEQGTTKFTNLIG